MKIEVRGSELEECVDDLKKIIDAAPGEMVTLSAEADGTEKGRVTVRRIDGGNMAELKVDARVLEPGAVTVRFQELTQACAPFFRDKATVACGLTYVTIGSGPARVSIENHNAECDHLPEPSAKAPRATFSSGDLLAVLQAVDHARSEDSSYRRSLCGIQLEVDADMKLRAVATDGRRLCTSTAQITRAELNLPKFEQFLPHKAVEFIMRVLMGETVTIYQLANSVGIETGGSFGIFVTNGITFPKWRTCVPVKPTYRATFNGGELADALDDAISALHYRPTAVDEDGEPAEEDFCVHIYSAGPGKAELTVKRADSLLGDYPKFFTTVSCQTPDAGGFTADFNARYLIEAIGDHEGKVEAYADFLHSGGKQFGPFTFKFPDDPDTYEVLMPLRNG